MPFKTKEKKIEQIKGCITTQMAEIVDICGKLSQLEKQWQTLFTGEKELLGRKTMPGKCVIEKDGIEVKIFVANNAIITSLKFKEKIFRAEIEKFLNLKVKKIEFSAGKTDKFSFAKEEERVFERNAAVYVSQEQIEKEKKELLCFTKDDSLAEIIAKTKVLAEKKAKKNKRS